MHTTTSLKRKIGYTVISTAISLLAAFITKKVKDRMDEKKSLATADKQLNRDLKDSMDCSDPVAKY